MSTREQVIDLTDQGYSARQISTLLGVSTQNVYKHLKAAGMRPNRKAKVRS